ncbi:MAG: hypothetical protein WCJ96_09795 [Verrucomicrobiota bacterium]|jgi:hypothetical protein
MRRSSPWVIAVVLILGAGYFSECSWKKIRPCIPEIGRKELEPTIGQGVLLGILGGFRTVVADLTWIRSYVMWERRDRAGCEALMRAACALDPHSRYFWENTGYSIGYDLAHWEIIRRGGYKNVPQETQERLFRSYARRGLDVLDDGLNYSKSKLPLLVCAGQLAEIKLKDSALASRYYHEAAVLPYAPWYAARIAAHLDWDLGKREEAYQWYRGYWLSRMKGVDDGYPDDLVQIREMEKQLKLTPQARLPKQAWEK